jgi:hypothetical protein
VDTLIDFEWWKDPAGYMLLAAEPDNPDPSLGILGGAGRPERVVSKSLDRVTFRPSGAKDLHLLFAHLRTAADVLNFVQKFGPITEFGARIGDDVALVLQHAEAFRGWIAADKNVRKRASALLDGKSPVFARLDASLDMDALGKVRLKLRPRSLLSAAWLQLAQVLSETTLRTCAHCGKFFEAGHGSGRRLDSRFCSKEHQIIYNSLKRSC